MHVLLLFSLVLFSCSLGPTNLQVRTADDLRSRGIKRIAAMPVEFVSGTNLGTSSYGSNEPPQRRTLEKSPGALVTDYLYAALVASPNWQVVSEREVGEMRATIPDGSGNQARKLGELVFADGVVFGRVVRFRNRVGEDLGVQSPASVAFTLQLMDVKRGDIVWTAEYQETQKPLSANLFAIGDFTRRGAKWLTAEELARDGVQKAVEQLNQMLYR
jgi:curli biogenesis system outer membrane secretion channel CsgG